MLLGVISGEDYHLGLSQSTTHRCIHEVTTVIEEQLAGIHINFPNNRVLINRHKQEFMAKYNFPGIVGAIDVAILKPVNAEHNFINRKGYHSLNIQIICDSNLKILNINANFAGATHDSFISRQSVETI